MQSLLCEGIHSPRSPETVSLERRTQGGMGAGKAAAIGVASGVGSFFAAFAIFVAVL